MEGVWAFHVSRAPTAGTPCNSEMRASNNIDGSYFKAGKMLGGRIRFNKHREMDGKLKFCRIVRRPSGWYLQAVCEDAPIPLPANDNVIGLDFGITT